MNNTRQLAAVCAFALSCRMGSEAKGQVVRPEPRWPDNVQWAMARVNEVAEAPPVSRPALDVRVETKPATSIATSRQASATQPEASSAAAGNFPAVGGSFGLEEFIQHFAPYE